MNEGSQTFDVDLRGCRPEPLASYLKALAVLRLVGAQADPEAKGFWHGESFVLRSRLNAEALTDFFLNEWRPTPVVAPWNGGSGFWPKDNRDAADAILASTDARLQPFARCIDVARRFVNERGWTERPDNEDKFSAIAAMRARLPDEALSWIDAVVVLGDDRLMFPPLLGTGGNDGRLDFSNNFQQRVVEVMRSGDRASLASALFGTPARATFKGVMGQFQPAAGARTNPWDFVLMIEGSLMFAAAATRRYESASVATMAFPFHARAASGGTVTDADEDDSRDELWLPLWSSPATSRGIKRLFAEGRAVVGSGDRARTAVSALDFGRAVASLGVDRGLTGFVRVGFHVRNGLAYFATPLGRFETRNVRNARLFDEIDAWYARVRSATRTKNVPARLAAARRRFDEATLAATSSGSVAGVVLALADLEWALAISASFTRRAGVPPAPRLSAAWWDAVADGTIEYRLAASLAGRPRMRRALIPLDASGRSFNVGDDAAFVFRERPFIENLHALLRREDIAERESADVPRATGTGAARASLTDVADFIAERVDDYLVARWLRALVLIEGTSSASVPEVTELPPAAFAVLALAHHRRIDGNVLPRTPGLVTHACAGRSLEATRLAIRRLHGAGRRVPVSTILEPPMRIRRIAAALAFSLTAQQRHSLERIVLSTSDATAFTVVDS